MYMSRGFFMKNIMSSLACMFVIAAIPASAHSNQQGNSIQAFGQQILSETKTLHSDELIWTAKGVTGRNVGAIYFSNGTQSGRYEILEEGSDIWIMHLTEKGGKKEQYRFKMLKRKAGSIALVGIGRVLTGTKRKFYFQSKQIIDFPIDKDETSENATFISYITHKRRLK